MVTENTSQDTCQDIWLIVIIMEICKVPILQLKALNKHSITHIIYIEIEMLSAIKLYIRKKKKLTHNETRVQA